MSCSGGLIEGGVFKDGTFVGCDISNGTITACALKGCSIESLVSIDDASTKTIVLSMAHNPDNMALFIQEICNLPDDVLRPLQQRLQGLLVVADEPVVMSGKPPVKEVVDYLPTTVVGESLEVLGRPQGWLTMGDGLVTPLYRTECA